MMYDDPQEANLCMELKGGGTEGAWGDAMMPVRLADRQSVIESLLLSKFKN